MWKAGDLKFLMVRGKLKPCTIVAVDDANTVLVDYEGLEEPVRVSRARLID